jgi:hypothetical protein
VGKEDNACECNVSEDKSCDLEAHDRSIWVDGVGTKGMWGHVSEKSEKWG